MKRTLTILIATVLLVATAHRSYAAFPAHSIKSESGIEAANHKTVSERKVPQLISRVTAMPFPDHVKDDKSDKSGWQGIVSLVCGVVGIFAAPLLFSTAAIVFGILGVNSKKHIYTGMAIAGLILGGIGFLYALAVLLK